MPYGETFYDYFILYILYVLQAHGGSIESSGLGDMFDSSTGHLTTSHFAFLRHWDWLIDLEAKVMEVTFEIICVA